MGGASSAPHVWFLALGVPIALLLLAIMLVLCRNKCAPPSPAPASPTLEGHVDAIGAASVTADKARISIVELKEMTAGSVAPTPPVLDDGPSSSTGVAAVPDVEAIRISRKSITTVSIHAEEEEKV